MANNAPLQQECAKRNTLKRMLLDILDVPPNAITSATIIKKGGQEYSIREYKLALQELQQEKQVNGTNGWWWKMPVTRLDFERYTTDDSEWLKHTGHYSIY